MATYEPRDKYYRKAREKGLVSRAAFKIEELIARSKLVARGGRVADLGCAPGGWMVILARAAGPQGRVVGVDLARCANPPPGTVTIVGDITDAATANRVIEALGGPADLVTSDLAPKLTGIAVRDEAQSERVLEAALDFARRALRPGGAMVAKVFMGSEFKRFIREFERDFAQVEVTRTAATRPGSSELYVVAQGFKHPG
ncbi:MAG TPA: RlmE family RNA methyltransferase [Candidatus Binataceae bacterium]|nr:RlmE family RNA methyltransferase [Candidatus Binataceae bacterium]